WEFFRDSNFQNPYGVVLGKGIYDFVQNFGIKNDDMSSLNSLSVTALLQWFYAFPQERLLAAEETNRLSIRPNKPYAPARRAGAGKRNRRCRGGDGGFYSPILLLFVFGQVSS